MTDFAFISVFPLFSLLRSLCLAPALQLLPEIESIRAFMHSLPVRKVPGVGRVCEKMLLAFGLDTCGGTINSTSRLSPPPLSISFLGGAFAQF